MPASTSEISLQPADVGGVPRAEAAGRAAARPRVWRRLVPIAAAVAVLAATAAALPAPAPHPGHLTGGRTIPVSAPSDGGR